MAIDQQFNTINEKLQLLLRQYGRLQKENDRLKDELQSATQRELQAGQKVTALQQQLNILKVSSGEMNENDKKEFEKRINQYIREIDKYISFLSQ